MAAGSPAIRPAFLYPLIGVLLGDDVHHVAAAQILGIEMTAGAQPLDMT